MITHIVLLKVSPDVQKSNLNELLEKLGSLRYSTIPQIQDFTYGENNSPENMNMGYTYGFSMKFLSSDDREYYLKHPDHIQIAQKIIEMLVDGINSVMVFDY